MSIWPAGHARPARQAGKKSAPKASNRCRFRWAESLGGHERDVLVVRSAATATRLTLDAGEGVAEGLRKLPSTSGRTVRLCAWRVN
jgi:hypothetical protein